MFIFTSRAGCVAILFLSFSVTISHAADVTFGRACKVGRTVTIAAVGDVLLHKPVQVQGFGASDGFQSLWRPVTDLIKMADISYANFEGPSAVGLGRRGRDTGLDPNRFDNHVYTGYPQFNSSPRVICARSLRTRG